MGLSIKKNRQSIRKRNTWTKDPREAYIATVSELSNLLHDAITKQTSSYKAMREGNEVENHLETKDDRSSNSRGSCKGMFKEGNLLFKRLRKETNVFNFDEYLERKEVMLEEQDQTML